MRIHPVRTLVASVVTLLVVGAAGGGEAPAKSSLRIKGGAPPAQPWPATGYLTHPVAGGTRLCAGTLISGRWFLTAAHCVYDPVTPRRPGDPDSVLVAAGQLTVKLGRASLDLATPGDDYTVDLVVAHPHYGEPTPHDNDLALLHISSPAAPAMEPLRLAAPSDAALWTAGARAIALGWGRTCETSCPPSRNLLQGNVSIVSDAACKSTYSVLFRPSTMLCAVGAVASTCDGDSGGPLIQARQGEAVLVGVTSWGKLVCDSPRYPGVFARIGDPVLNRWILGYAPSAAFSVSPPAPRVGDTVTLTAASSQPAQRGAPTFTWDLDGDDRFDDATGPVVRLPATRSQSSVLGLQAAYSDQDRTLARERVTVSPAQVVPRAPRLVDVPSTVHAAGLRDHRIAIRVRCSAACDIKATLRRSGAAIGTGHARSAKAATVRVTIRLTARAVRALRRASRSRVALHVTVTQGASRTKLDRVVEVRR